MPETDDTRASNLKSDSTAEGNVTGKGARTCLSCGAVEAPGNKLLRCSGCLSVSFCNASCQKAVWKEHKAQCTRCKKFDVYAASPLLAAFAFLPRMHTIAKPLTYEVSKRELRGRELHLYLRNPGRVRASGQEFDVSGRIRDGPSREQLHNMVQHDGYLEAIVVGSLYGFHCAVQQYNSRSLPNSTSLDDYAMLLHRTAKITEYGIAIGSTCPDYALVYHMEDGKARQLQDPNNHVWMYFGTERSDRLFLDVGSLSYGMGLMFDIINYLPEGTPESQIRQLTPVLGAPGAVLDQGDLRRMEAAQPGSTAALRRQGPGGGYLADRERVPVSGLPADGDPEAAITGLLQQIKEKAAAAAGESTAAAAAVAAEAEATKALGMVAAAAVVTAAAVAANPDGRSGSLPARIRSGGGATSSASAKRGGGSSGGGGGGGAKRPHIPFRDSPLDKHVARALLHFECAFNNTYAVLEQATYKRYPNPDAVRSFASWVKPEAWS